MNLDVGLNMLKPTSWQISWLNQQDLFTIQLLYVLCYVNSNSYITSAFMRTLCNALGYIMFKPNSIYVMLFASTLLILENIYVL